MITCSLTIKPKRLLFLAVAKGKRQVFITSPSPLKTKQVPVSCLGFYLCPSYLQKRTGNAASPVSPSPSPVCIFCKALRPFSMHDRMLFYITSDVRYDPVLLWWSSKETPTHTAAILLYRSFGDMIRANPRYHGIILEGGFDELVESKNPLYLANSIEPCINHAIGRFFLKRERGKSTLATGCLPISLMTPPLMTRPLLLPDENKGGSEQNPLQILYPESGWRLKAPHRNRSHTALLFWWRRYFQRESFHNKRLPGSRWTILI